MPTQWALKWDGLNKYLHVHANETLVEEGLATLDPKDSHGRPSRKLACIVRPFASSVGPACF